MIEYDTIRAIVENPELSKTELEIVSYLDEKISETITREFPSTDTIYVSEVLFTDTFRSKNIPQKRRPFIIHELMRVAARAGWLLERDNSTNDNLYYTIMPKKK